jgi:DNA-binding PadR family transcriptional regulator
MADQSQPLSPTGRVILGMLALGKCTGYDIKQFVDKSTRFFWAASYGQIYPELKRLEAQGLVRGRPEPSGGRARTVFALTDEGRQALEAWLTARPELGYELRDEGMLKLFFSDAVPEARIEHVRAMREQCERKLAALKQVEPHAATGPLGPRLTLSLGITTTQCMIDWCEAAERRLTENPNQE